MNRQGVCVYAEGVCGSGGGVLYGEVRGGCECVCLGVEEIAYGGVPCDYWGLFGRGIS